MAGTGVPFETVPGTVEAGILVPGITVVPGIEPEIQVGTERVS